MQYLPKEGYQRILVLFFYIIIAVIALTLFLHYLFIPLLPFLIAALISVILQQPIRFLSSKIRIPRKIIAFILVLICFGILFGLTFWVGSRIFFECKSLIGQVLENGSMISGLLDNIMNFVTNISERIPIFKNGGEMLEKLSGEIDTFFVNMIKNIASGSAAKFSDGIGKVAAALPGILIFLLVTVISSIYFTMDYAKIVKFIASKLPQKIVGKFSHAKQQMFHTSFCYIKAYIMIMTITFFELLIGFLILKIRYAALLAAVTSLIDILPIFGVGIILFPNSLYYFLCGDIYRGIGLLLLYVLITVVRQVIEPRIVGKLIGIYPPLTLIAMYVGYALFGFAGFLLFPLALLLLWRLKLSNKQQPNAIDCPSPSCQSAEKIQNK